MNKNKFLRVILTFAAFCCMGCFSGPAAPKKPDPVPVKHSFAETNNANVTATIIFTEEKGVGVRLVDCDGISRPAPAEGTYWERNSLYPVGKPLDLRVYIYWKGDVFGDRRRGIFKCPPLDAGKSYKLWYKGGLKGGSIILTYANVDTLTYSSKGQPQFEILCEQIIPPLPK